MHTLLTKMKKNFNHLFNKFTIAILVTTLFTCFHPLNAQEETPNSENTESDSKEPDSRYFLTPVEVTSRKQSSEAFHSSTPVNIISKEKLARKMPVSVDELFKDEPGLNVSSTGVGTSRPMIRGLYDARVLILIDGVKLSEQRPGGNHALSIDPAMVERVEVVRGPASVLYGSDALGGVINFITKKEERRMEEAFRLNGEVSTGFDSAYQAIMTNALVRGGVGGFNFYINGAYTDTQNLQTPSGELKHSATESYNLAGGANYVWTKGYADIRYIGRKADLGIPLADFVDYKQAKFDDETHHAVISTFNFEDLTTVWKQLHFDLSYQQHNRRLRNILANDDKVNIDIDLDTINLNPYATFRFGKKHRLTAGLQYLHEFEKSDRVHPSSVYDGVGVIPDSNRLGFGVFLQEEIFLKSDIDILLGLRYDIFRSETEGEEGHPVEAATEYDQNISGNIGVVLGLIPKLWHLRMNLGRAFRAPTLHERFFFGPHQATIEQGNPDLKPETSWNVDIGSEWSHKRIRASVGFFYNYIQDYIEQYPTGDPNSDPWTWDNINDAVLYGVEFDSEVNVTKWFILFGNLTFVRGQNITDDTDLVDIPPVKGSYGFRLEKKTASFNNWFELRLNSAARQDKTGSEKIEATDGYTTLDFRLGTEYAKIIFLSLYLKNALDKGYNDHLSRVDQLEYNQPGRSFGINLKYVF